jgi:NAD(P) transhydrogenase
MKHYDLVIIGSGAAGEKAAIHAAYHGYKVAVVERALSVGGAAANTGTMPSKTLKETALYLSGAEEKGLYGVERKLTHDPEAADFLFRERNVVKVASEKLRHELLTKMVEMHFGVGRFLDSHRIEVTGKEKEILHGDYILIASGSYPTHPANISFDRKHIHDSDTILQIDHIPRSLCIVGAGVIGCEYATIFAVMGSKVKLVNSHREILPFLDREVADALVAHMKELGIEILGETQIETATVESKDGEPMVRATLKPGDPLEVDMLLFAAGRNGNTADLDCEKAGLHVDEREALKVDETYRTSVPHIYAAGDVIGFPALGSTSMDQGRVAVTNMFGLHEIERVAKEFPFGVYTIPEVSMIGLTEEAAKKKGIDYIATRVDYQNVPRGIIIGAKLGFLKLIVERQSSKVLGVHIFGVHATELIHYGMEMVENGETITRILGTVFNFPTLHELYKFAAYKVWAGEPELRQKSSSF